MPMRVLIAEDDTVSRRLLQAMLTKWGYEVLVARDGAEAWQVLSQDDSPNLAILDWMMPNIDGVELCRRARQLRGRGYVYIILLTAKGRKEDVIEGIEGGADDYLVKPIHAGEFRARLRAASRILDLQTQLLAAQEALLEQATHDPLTGLWNRPAVFAALERDLARASRENSPVGVLMADLDHFKRVNDTFGHDIGDEVLRQAADRMHSVIRAYDTLGRYGGEEFLIVAPGCTVDTAASLGERIRLAIAKQPILAGETPLTVNISLGAAACNNGSTQAATLVQAADQAMYKAKNAGRNRVETCDCGVPSASQ